MATGADFKKGDKVSFLPGPASKAKVTATVTGHTKAGNFDFLLTKDADGKERKIAAGRCTKVAA